MSKLIISILGSETLLGRELREQLSEQSVPGRVNSIAAIEAESAIITQRKGEPVVIPGFDPIELRQSDVAFLAGSAQMSRQAFETVKDRGPVLIDLTGGLEDHPPSHLRAPMIEQGDIRFKLHVIAHPAAIAIALVLRRLHGAYPVRHSIFQIFEPASERGQAGIEELQKQTASLLSFRPLEKKVFDAQVSFNLVARYGDEAPEKLEDIEHRIDRHAASLLAPAGVPLPSIRLIQAPVFHGYGISAWIEFESLPAVAAIGEALASTHIDVRGADLDPPTNVGAAGQSGIAVGAIEADRSHPKAAWLWIAFDNYRLRVDNAILVGRESLV